MLSIHQANALAVMGAFVLVFIIRMAGHHGAEGGRRGLDRLSEDRFRSLIRNSPT